MPAPIIIPLLLAGGVIAAIALTRKPPVLQNLVKGQNYTVVAQVDPRAASLSDVRPSEDAFAARLVQGIQAGGFAVRSVGGQSIMPLDLASDEALQAGRPGSVVWNGTWTKDASTFAGPDWLLSATATQTPQIPQPPIPNLPNVIPSDLTGLSDEAVLAQVRTMIAASVANPMGVQPETLEMFALQIEMQRPELRELAVLLRQAAATLRARQMTPPIPITGQRLAPSIGQIEALAMRLRYSNPRRARALLNYARSLRLRRRRYAPAYRHPAYARRW